MRIGIYGGSFNPVHYGHLNLARTAIAELSLDKLIVIPANVSPFKVKVKGEGEQRNVSDATVQPSVFNLQPALYDRIARVHATFADVEKAVVDLREIERGGVSYAIDTVREIAAENPGAEIYFLIGEDSVEGLPRWKDYDELKMLCTFKAYPRTKESSTEVRKLFEDAKVVLNPDEKLAKVVEQGVVRKNGFCPCRLPKLPEFFCPCDEFKGQMADPSYHGLCHCRLYLKL